MDDGSDRASRLKRRPLRVHWWPLVGLLALAGAVACVFAGLAILLQSNGNTVSSHSTQPSVYLSITATASNALIRFALAQALPIIWWRHAHRGTTVRALHQEWRAGSSVTQALASWRYFGLTPLACLATALLVFDGPLLQKASTVVQTVPSEPLPLQIRIAPELPTGAGGTLLANGDWQVSVSEESVFQDWLHGRPIIANVTGSEGTCAATVRGPGLARHPVQCAEWNVTLDGNDLARWPQNAAGQYLLFDVKLAPQITNDSLWLGPTAPATTVPPDLPNFDLDRETVATFVATANTADGQGTMSFSQCGLVSAILEYEIVVSETSTIQLSNSQDGLPVVALSNNTRPAMANQTTESTIGLLFEQAGLIFNTAFTFTSGSNTTIENIVTQSANLSSFGLQYITSRGSGTFQITDPTTSLMSALNEMMFRGGIAAASQQYAEWTEARIDGGLSLDQSLTGRRIDQISVYRSELRWWAGASVLQLLAIVLIASMILPWWRLEHRVSFSPVEVARAFDAPVLRGADAEAGIDEVLAQVGGLRVRYRSVAIDDLRQQERAESKGQDVRSSLREISRRLMFTEDVSG